MVLVVDRRPWWRICMASRNLRSHLTFATYLKKVVHLPLISVLRRWWEDGHIVDGFLGGVYDSTTTKSTTSANRHPYRIQLCSRVQNTHTHAYTHTRKHTIRRKMAIIIYYLHRPPTPGGTLRELCPSLEGRRRPCTRTLLGCHFFRKRSVTTHVTLTLEGV
jgi:hypothetical protein